MLRKCEELGVTVVMFSGHPESNLPLFAHGLKLLAKPYTRTGLDQMLGEITRQT